MDIIYKLTAIVDDEIVFESEYFDTLELESELGKAEDIVEQRLEAEQALEDRIRETAEEVRGEIGSDYERGE